ncbi:YTH domain-containing protein ECT2 isoform X2 [Spinacia oleracea]|nr:YTH domain-containing protein ECT2-like isoform X2 [Spinacia oleracea]
MDPTLCYVPNTYHQHTAYYYGGYDGTCNEWDDYSRYINQDGVGVGLEMSPAVYGDTASIMYHHGFGYAPYAPYSPSPSPVPSMPHESHLFGHQQYQYPAPYYPPLTTTCSTYTNPPPAVSVSSAPAVHTPLSVEPTNTVSTANTVSTVRPAYQNSTYNMPPYGKLAASGYQDPRFAFDGIRSPVPWLDAPIFADGHPRPVTNNSYPSSVSNGNGLASARTHKLQPHASVMSLHQPRPMSNMGMAQGYINRMYPNKLYGHYANGVRAGLGFGNNGYDARVNGRAWFAVDNRFKNKSRGNGFLGYGNENMDGLNELNRGPRAKASKSIRSIVPVALADRGQSSGNQDEKANMNMTPDREEYNCPDFMESYTEAKFFVIKSYSEDDVHKSIKYNVWSSTPNGNKKLDLAYKEAQQKSSGCPVFLFFSVNTSGQFVGLAEMVGPVDFQKNVEYWQQDKWNGNFPVKWHMVKDVPNSLLKLIILENNENKPVTNSRDTQEVKLEQGLEMLKIFKEHTSKTCILDDFGFYEVRQKTIQEKKAKQQQFHKQVWEGKNSGDKNKDGKEQVHKSVEVGLDLSKGVESNGDSDTGV